MKASLMAHRILIVGKDETLVKTRALVLNSRYETESTDPKNLNDRLREGHFDLLLVCYSVEPEAADNLIFRVHKKYPDLCIVRVLTAWGPQSKNPHAHAVIRVTFEPRAWADEIDRLLAQGVTQGFK